MDAVYLHWLTDFQYSASHYTTATYRNLQMSTTAESYYQYHVFFCTNQRKAGEQCCQNHDALNIRNYLKQRLKELNLIGKGKVRPNTAGCLDRCDLGPVMVIYPQAVWYTFVDQEDIDEIISEHLQNGRIVERLRI